MKAISCLSSPSPLSSLIMGCKQVDTFFVLMKTHLFYGLGIFSPTAFAFIAAAIKIFLLDEHFKQAI
jgi:hypothetical protein